MNPILCTIVADIGAELAILTILAFLIYSVLWKLKLCCFASSTVNDQEPDIELGLPNHHGGQQQPQLRPRPQYVGVPSWSDVRFKRDDDEVETCCKDCAICLDDFEDGDECRVLNKCEHMFHKACMKQWLTRDTRCPLCRSSAYNPE